MSQKRAHKIIKLISANKTPPRKATTAELAKTQRAISALNGTAPTEEQLWANLRSKDVSRSIQNFQWKGLHAAHKVGTYFADMPSPWKELAECPRCNTTESMEHILFECTDPARETIWALAKETLAQKMGSCPDISIGTVWGCASAVFEGEEKEEAMANARAFRIIVSESAFLIWKARCERRIQHEDEPDWEMTVLEATNRWKAAINKRIAIDRALTNKRRHKRRALETQTVFLTWCDILEHEESLDKDWPWRPGVLVGIGTGRNRQHI
ncbi:hypothetical protein EXIGLDRAFT_715325 [Exidia glandulosa HHB12029]|uniref:Reverse transcriptase zinc-binding domain-containing protein n=1 Tax=Exidia glandulosa HHB12029 TaxID=1314781 RepID=A0A165JGU2_EXIGL|nr:hypothetical protein EXIGLDRAFT_715325 [Exidia glandulosa HHB12029]